MFVVPEGTMDEEQEEVLPTPESNKVDEIESVERALFLYFVTNNSSEINDSNDSDDEAM